MRTGRCSWPRRLALTLSAASALAAEELRILAWQGYADDDWVKEFEQETGVDVNVVFIGTDDEIWAKIKGSEGKDFDLFAVNTAQLQRYIDAGLVTPHDLSKVPEPEGDAAALPGPDQGLGRRCATARSTAFPSAFDSIGIIYDTDKVKTPPTSWDVFWDDEIQGPASSATTMASTISRSPRSTWASRIRST